MICWQHNQGLTCLSAAAKSKWTQTNSLLVRRESSMHHMGFVCECEEVVKDLLLSRHKLGELGETRDWEMWADRGQQLAVAREMISTCQQPDLVLWSNIQPSVYFELTVTYKNTWYEPFEKENWSQVVRLEGQCRSFGNWLSWICSYIHQYFVQGVQDSVSSFIKSRIWNGQKKGPAALATKERCQMRSKAWNLSLNYNSYIRETKSHCVQGNNGIATVAEVTSNNTRLLALAYVWSYIVVSELVSRLLQFSRARHPMKTYYWCNQWWRLTLLDAMFCTIGVG